MEQFLNWKLFRGNLAPLYESYIELAAFLAVFLLAAAAMAARRHRQLTRRAIQAASIVVFFFVVSSCLGVFGLIRNFYFGLGELGKDDLRAFYFMGITSVVLGLTVSFGPLFCGWICPTGTLQEWMGSLRTGLRARNRPIALRAAGVTLAILATVAYLLVIAGLFASRRPLAEDSAVLWASALMVVTVFIVVRPGADPAMKRLRYLSLALLVGLCVAGFTVASPVHFVFANVHDRASLLSTLVIMGAALLVSRTWCRYLCPFGLVLCAIGKHALVRVECGPGCTACGKCDQVCTTGAIRRGQIDPMACTMCLACVDSCPEGALVVRQPGVVQRSGGEERA